MVHQWILEDTEKLDPGSWSPMEILEAKFEANLIISILMLVDISWIFESQWRSEKKNHGLFDLLSVSFGHGMGKNCQRKLFFQHDVLGHGMTDLLARVVFPF